MINSTAGTPTMRPELLDACLDIRRRRSARPRTTIEIVADPRAAS